MCLMSPDGALPPFVKVPLQDLILKKIGFSNGSSGLCQSLPLRSSLKMEGVE